jgi:diguanylate cyclase (GGDEF)-like protein
MMARLWRWAVGRDVAEHFPFAMHRVLLGLLLAVTLFGQAMLSIDGARPDRLVDAQVLATESDANSVVTVQRESFNVALALGDWAHGAASARDVQVARALLSQRLSVVTRSSTSTATNVGASYLAALAALDAVILGLPDVLGADRAAHAETYEPVLQTFLTETRALNEIFQRLGREQIELVVAENRSRQRLQGILSVAIIVLIGLLSLSIVVAVGRGYRRVTRSLAQQAAEVRSARRDLDLVRELDGGVARLLGEIDAGTPARRVRELLEELVGGLIDDVEWIAARSSGGELLQDGHGADPEDGPGPGRLVAARARTVLDALERREASVEVTEAARRNDALTGLANRQGLVDGLERICSGRDGEQVLVCLLDVDRFGEVNGAVGVAGADRILVELATRLEDALAGRPDAVLARMAADEFAVAVPIATDEEGRRIVDGLRAACTYLSTAAGVEVAVTVSSGEARAALGSVAAGELLRRAAVGILLAKQSQERRGHVRFDPDAHDRLSDALVAEVAVRTALRAGQFRMHYQPIVDLASGRAVGLESLVRWQRPGVGLVPPSDFLPIIERSGFAVEFGAEVLTEVLAAWKRTLRAALVAVNGASSYVSVNVDAAQLADEAFETFVLSSLDRAAMEPRELVLELTEHTAVDRSLAATLGRLRSAGVRIAVDDFGSGYSSLGLSTRLPVDVLKLDRSFVSGLLCSDHDPAIFGDIARLARTLGMGLIAEGIETEDVAVMLRASGIVFGQGYLFSPALPEQEAVRWVRARGLRGADGDAGSRRGVGVAPSRVGSGR